MNPKTTGRMIVALPIAVGGAVLAVLGLWIIGVLVVGFAWFANEMMKE